VKKKVHFYKEVSVILIPQRSEFLRAGLADELWWNSSDYHSFKTIAIKEIFEYMKEYGVDIMTAGNDLYQN